MYLFSSFIYACIFCPIKSFLWVNLEPRLVQKLFLVHSLSNIDLLLHICCSKIFFHYYFFKLWKGASITHFVGLSVGGSHKNVQKNVFAITCLNTIRKELMLFLRNISISERSSKLFIEDSICHLAWKILKAILKPRWRRMMRIMHLGYHPISKQSINFDGWWWGGGIGKGEGGEGRG